MELERSQCEKYRKFATERLQNDYEQIIKVINKIMDEVKEYEALLLFINKAKSLDPNQPLKMQISIGKNVFCETVIDKWDHIIVRLSDDVFAELTMKRAEEFVPKKIALLNERVTFHENQAYSIRARIHLILSSVKQLESL
ncbi:unnamed protein product [Thelazia callipaeda]|uniref:Protein UXT homolog n=1 Tax=Thelazia callipaeda TaxID=103827 RepID=A0A0N5CJQ9_THECL|nr:unnamed protein product [Thelazia callipaeda]